MTAAILWAICNSLIANAYVYAHLGKRDITTGELKRMPVPSLSTEHTVQLTQMVNAFFGEAQKPKPKEKRLGELLYRIDAVLLSAYGLFAPAEQEILALFDGHRRPGLAVEIPVGTSSRLPQYLTVSGLRPILPAQAEIGRYVALADLDAEIDDGRRELAALRREEDSGDARVADRMVYVRSLLQRIESAAADKWQSPERRVDG